MATKPASIDDYLAPLSADKRAALEKLRATIRAAVPAAEECISYDMPAFRLNGTVLVWFAAGAKHCALHCGKLPLTTHANALGAYETSKGTVRFSPAHPLPTALVKKLVKTRLAEKAAAPKANHRDAKKR